MKKTLLLLGVTALLNACVSPTKIPPVHQTAGTSAFVWHDLISNTPETSEGFYSSLFGWTFEEIDSAYSLIRDNHFRVGGLVHNTTSSGTNQTAVWLSVIAVENITDTLERIKNNGGTIIKPAEEVPDRGIIAVVADPEGAFLQIVQTPVSIDASKEDTLWIWHELICEDPEASATWYADIFGLSVEKTADGKRQILKKEGRMLASVSENPFTDTRSQWIPVLEVTNFDQVVKQCEELGGRVEILPTPGGNKIALLLDPSNAPLVIQAKGGVQ